MQVILVESVSNLGRLGDVVDVRSGYARNYLLPRGVARMATPENRRELEAQRAELERLEAEKLEGARREHYKLDGQTVTIQARVGAEDKLFGSVSAGDIADALAAASGVEVEKRNVRLPDGPLRTTGEFEIAIHVHADLDANITVVVEAEEEG
jgi:large subunit ribosomal protein L9